MQLTVDMPINKVTELTGISNHKIWAMLDKYVEQVRSEQELSEVTAIGIGEASFEKQFKDWYYWVTHSQLLPMIKVAKTIKRHWYGIVSWMESKINNGILEGLNSVIQATKRKARGYKTKHFKTIAYLLTAKLDFSSQNRFLPT